MVLRLIKKQYLFYYYCVIATSGRNMEEKKATKGAASESVITRTAVGVKFRYMNPLLCGQCHAGIIYTTHAVERMAVNIPKFLFPIRVRVLQRLNMDRPKRSEFRGWWQSNKPKLRSISLNQVEYEVENPGKTGLAVVRSEERPDVVVTVYSTSNRKAKKFVHWPLRVPDLTYQEKMNMNDRLTGCEYDRLKKFDLLRFYSKLKIYNEISIQQSRYKKQSFSYWSPQQPQRNQRSAGRNTNQQALQHQQYQRFRKGKICQTKQWEAQLPKSRKERLPFQQIQQEQQRKSNSKKGKIDAVQQSQKLQMQQSKSTKEQLPGLQQHQTQEQQQLRQQSKSKKGKIPKAQQQQHVQKQAQQQQSKSKKGNIDPAQQPQQLQQQQLPQVEQHQSKSKIGKIVQAQQPQHVQQQAQQQAQQQQPKSTKEILPVQQLPQVQQHQSKSKIGNIVQAQQPQHVQQQAQQQQQSKSKKGKIVQAPQPQHVQQQQRDSAKEILPVQQLPRMKQSKKGKIVPVPQQIQTQKKLSQRLNLVVSEEIRKNKKKISPQPLEQYKRTRYHKQTISFLSHAEKKLPIPRYFLSLKEVNSNPNHIEVTCEKRLKHGRVITHRHRPVSTGNYGDPYSLKHQLELTCRMPARSLTSEESRKPVGKGLHLFTHFIAPVLRKQLELLLESEVKRRITPEQIKRKVVLLQILKSYIGEDSNSFRESSKFEKRRREQSSSHKKTNRKKRL
jgi:hypothetical protein